MACGNAKQRILEAMIGDQRRNDLVVIPDKAHKSMEELCKYNSLV